MIKNRLWAATGTAVVFAFTSLALSGANAVTDPNADGAAASATVIKNDAAGWMWYGMEPYENPALPDGAAHVGGPGTYAMYTFQGSGVDVYGMRALTMVVDKRSHRMGKLKISIDDKEQATIDMGAADADYHAKVFSITGLSAGNHVLQLDPVGGWAVVDSLVISGGTGEGPAKNALAAGLVAKSHLVGYWPCDEGAGETVGDKSGHNRNGFFQAGAKWTTDAKVGKGAVSFPQPGGVETSGPVVDTTKSYTVAAWVKVDQLTGYQTFVSIDGDDKSGFFLQIHGEGNRFTFALDPAHAFAPISPQTGQWYHLAGVYDAPTKTLAVFVNGELQAKEQAPPTTRSTGNTAFGRAKFGGNYVDFVNGSIDDIRVYDIALQPADIMALYEANK
ncbi:MAG: LamG domain-containing protein [Capsulimonas sp.]|uniref:LamG domain-containing protein n=1 Tax=Capsulimonas sp. TaxID=2494211 RepID=UPI003264618F